MRTAMKYAPSSLLRPFILSFVTTFLAPEPAMFREGAILLNKRGQRFTDELDKPGLEIPHQPGRVAYILFDRKLAKKFSEWPHFISTAPGLAYAYLPDYRRNRKDIYHEGSTLQAIAEKLKMPSDTLANTISRYNKEGTSPAGKRSALSEPPFVALGPVRSWVVLTDGGLKVTADHKIMRGDGSIVHGLFAAGSAGQGGLLLEGHGHHIGWALTSGRRAGRNAARNAPVISPDTRSNELPEE
jgi:fumarate reductase flavoprotein subunit